MINLSCKTAGQIAPTKHNHGPHALTQIKPLWQSLQPPEYRIAKSHKKIQPIAGLLTRKTTRQTA
jgi:hypothetical protein